MHEGLPHRGALRPQGSRELPAPRLLTTSRLKRGMTMALAREYPGAVAPVNCVSGQSALATPNGCGQSGQPTPPGCSDATPADLPAVAAQSGLRGRATALAPPREAVRAPLEKNASRVSGPCRDARQSARRVRYWLRDGVREWTALARVAKCGRCRCGSQVEVRLTAGAAHFRGVSSCGSVWACAVCAAKVSARRTGEIARTLGGHFAAGGGVEMLTMTLPHTAGDRLKRTRKLAADAWKRVQQGRAWLALKQRAGIVGSIRALEVTHGANGWHPHIHVLILTARTLTAEERERIRTHAFSAWRRSVVQDGHTAPQAHCTTMQAITDAGIAEYATKLGAALELTQGAAKLGRSRDSRTAFGILADFLTDGDANDLELWREWERDTKGARQLTWSKGLKALYGLAEKSDEEIARAADDEGELVGILTPGEWRAAVAVPGMRVQLLEVTERGGALALDAMLAQLRPPESPGKVR